MTSKRVPVTITREHIDGGQKGAHASRIRGCPLFLAAKDVAPQLYSMGIHHAYFLVNGRRIKTRLPGDARQFLRDADVHNRQAIILGMAYPAPEPCTVHLNVPRELAG